MVAFAAGIMLLFPLIDATSIPIPKSTFIFLILIVIALLQTAAGYSNQRSDAFLIIAYLMLCIVVLARGAHDGSYIVDQSTKNHSPLEIAAWAITGGALISAFLAFLQVLEVWEDLSFVTRMPIPRRAGGNLAQPNHLGSLLLLGLGSLIYLRECQRIAFSTLIACSAIIYLAAAATESRTALLGVFAFGIWSLVGNYKQIISISKSTIISLTFAAAFLFFLWPSIMAAISLFPPDASLNAQKGMRPIVWSQLISAILEKPWLGWGLKQVSSAHNSVADIFNISEPFSYAHNIVLELAIGVGIPLTLMLCALTAAWLVKKIKTTNSIHEWYCIQILLFLGLHSMLEFPYAYAYFLIPAMYAIGTLDGLHKNTKVIVTAKYTIPCALSIFGALYLWSIPQYLSKEDGFRIARFHALRISVTPTDNTPDSFTLFKQLADLNSSTSLKISKEIKEADITRLQKTAMQFPWPATQSRYALALALSGNSAEASRQLQIIRAMHGEKTFQSIATSWQFLAAEELPELQNIQYLEKPSCIYWPCPAQGIHTSSALP